jgi:eukaryotic-like serine/threonine-protein kinase
MAMTTPSWMKRPPRLCFPVMPASLLASGIRQRRTGVERAAEFLGELVHALWSFVRDVWRRPSLVGWFGPYLLSEQIGQGGMGVVFKGSHRQSRRPVAIKLLPSGRTSEIDLKRFRREACLTSSLRHPNTIDVFDFGKTRDGALFYVMEYVDGRDLQTLVDVEGPQSPARVAYLLAELSAALSEVHEKGLLHGDVKPANVMCSARDDGTDQVKVLDFGLARRIGAVKESWAGDRDALVGTPLYLAPEALLEPETVDGRSDLYAVGAVGYFLLTGTPPFTGRTVLDVLTQHLHAEPVPPSKRLGAPVPRELEALILRCLAKAPEARPVSAAALCDALLPLTSAGPSRSRGCDPAIFSRALPAQ